MISRILPPEEWPVGLKGTEAETAWPHFDPEQTQVIVVEHEGRIVGTWTVMRTVHVECLWAAPEYRGSFGVCKRLLKAMREVASAWGASVVYTGSASAHVTELIRRFGGVPSPVETFILPLEIASSRRREDRERGREFHRQINAQIPEDAHADDPEHDERVGKALRTAVEGGDPVRAEAEYNEWARGARYEPVNFLSWGTDGKLRADIKTAIVEVDEQYRVTVLEEESCQQPQ